MAGLAVVALALNAPAASANHATINCRFNAVTQAAATGQDTWEGVAEGYIVGNPDETVNIRCVVRVNGSVRAATDYGSGQAVATTSGRVTFTRTLTEVTQLCAQYSITRNGQPVESGEVCFGTTTTQIPPQEVIDALQPVFDKLTEIEVTYVDPNLCPLLKPLIGRDIGPLSIRGGKNDSTGTPGADIYVNNALFWDCPGYE